MIPAIRALIVIHILGLGIISVRNGANKVTILQVALVIVNAKPVTNVGNAYELCK